MAGMRWILATLVCVATIIFMAVLMVGAISNGYKVLEPLKAVDVATISLAAASLSVTCVAIVVAIVGVFGFSQIRDTAVSAATAEAVKKAAEVASAIAARTTSDYLATQVRTDAGEDIAAAVAKEGND